MKNIYSVTFLYYDNVEYDSLTFSRSVCSSGPFFFSSRGKKYDLDSESFAGVNPKSNIFKKGEIIQFLEIDTIEIGIITSTPIDTKKAALINKKLERVGGSLDSTDNSYTIDFFKHEHYSHSHICEGYIQYPSVNLDPNSELIIRLKKILEKT